MLKRFSSIIIILTAFNIHIKAQDYELKFKNITRPNGESLGVTRGFTQDTNGYIWFGGESSRCLYRYDGLTIKTFKHDEFNPNSLANGEVTSVYADKNGVIWIGLNTGLDRYDPSTGIFTHLKNDASDPASLKGGGVWQVFGDSKGRLWLATNGLGLLDEKTGKIKYFTHDPNDPKSLSSNSISHIYEDKEGFIWLACNYPWWPGGPEVGGLNRLEENGTFTRFMHDPKDPNSLINNKVIAMFEDSRGTFWVGTHGDGLHTMDRKTGKFERLRHDSQDPQKISRPWPIEDNRDIVSFVEEDVVGKIWIGSVWSGINRYDPEANKITLLKNSFGFNHRSGFSIFQSRDGVLWISSVDDVLYRVDPFYKPIEFVKTSVEVQKFYEDKESGDIWLATMGKGLARLNKNLEWKENFKHEASNPTSLADKNSEIFNILQVQQNLIWTGTPTGLEIFDKSTKKFGRFMVNGKPDSAFIKAPIVNVLIEDDSVFWLTTWGKGLLRFNSKTSKFDRYLKSQDKTSINSDLLSYIYKDPENNIWIAGTNGIDRFERQTETFKHYLSGNNTSLFIDSKSNILCPTSSGLYIYNKSTDKFDHYFDPTSNLYRTDFQGILEDQDKNLWLNSRDGSFIVRIDAITKEPYVFDERFGVKPNSITRAIYQLQNGKILVGAYDGFYAFDPNELKPLPNKSSILITDFQVNGKPVIDNKEIKLNGTIETAKELNLNYDQNNLSFQFASSDYRNPESTLYFVQLEGYDSAYRQVLYGKKADYFNLSRGVYKLKVRASFFDGTSTEHRLILHIMPPWWQTWWAYSSYVIFFILSVWGASKYRSQSLERQNKLLEEKVTLRTEALNKSLNELKSTQAQLIQSEKMASLGELTAGIAHEIQNPLNFVNNFSEVSSELVAELNTEIENGNTKDAKEIAGDLKQNLEKINHHGKRAADIVKGMLQHSRTSSGQKELTDINALADEYLRLAYHGLRAKDKSFNAKFETHLDPTLPKLNVIPQDIGRVILNLINNAFFAVNEKNKRETADVKREPSHVSPLTSVYVPLVTVSTKKLEGKIEISVKDNGSGIPNSIKEKIFQPFFTTKPTGQGTGLGLSLSYDIITKGHDGEILVKSEENGGSEFIIKLPYH